MATIKLIGMITDIFPVETRPNFSKRVFWVKEPDTERYPNHWAFELHTIDIDRLKGLEVGDRIECEVDVRGRKYIARGEEAVATTLKCVGIRVIEKIGSGGGILGTFKPKPKPGREQNGDNVGHQPTLPLA